MNKKMLQEGIDEVLPWLDFQIKNYQEQIDFLEITAGDGRKLKRKMRPLVTLREYLKDICGEKL